MEINKTKTSIFLHILPILSNFAPAMEITYTDMVRSLSSLYGHGEAKAIVLLLLDKCFGLSQADVYSGKEEDLSADDRARLKMLFGRLMQAEPVQYVIGKADFCGREFIVKPGVLIPRPETEQLISLITGDKHNLHTDIPQILDIGTGSGCIAVTLAAQLHGARVTAFDISDKALEICARNATLHHAKVSTEKVDILHPDSNDTRRWDVIVSNPPYICQKEKSEMAKNVLDYEPDLALFVDDDTPIIFYQSIALYAQTHLNAGGALYFEINPLYATDIERMLLSLGFSGIQAHDDIFGKKRFINCYR